MNELMPQIIKSNRKTISIIVKADNILIRAPKKAKLQEIKEFWLKKRKWIEKSQKELQEKQKAISNQIPYTKEELKELTKKAKNIISDKVKYYAPLVGVDYKKITIRSQRTRWGSCSSKGNLNFNCLLILLPEEIIDSIVVHELCHRKQMNHSAKFYKEVEKILPEYQKYRAWLKENGRQYLNRIQ